MKLLAAAEPLSLQVHPTSERARIRYAEQNAAGIADRRARAVLPGRLAQAGADLRADPLRGHGRLPGHRQDRAILRQLGLPWLDEIADQLEDTPTPFQTLRRVVTGLLAMSGAELHARLQELRTAAADAEARSHRPQPRLRPVPVEPSSLERESLRVFAQTPPLVDRYPDDAGVLVTLLLNHVVLAAGEAMFIDAGVIHAYTSGFGVEIMAASDNVLRAGLTPKHVDIPELSRSRTSPRSRRRCGSAAPAGRRGHRPRPAGRRVRAGRGHRSTARRRSRTTYADDRAVPRGRDPVSAGRPGDPRRGRVGVRRGRRRRGPAGGAGRVRRSPAPRRRATRAGRRRARGTTRPWRRARRAGRSARSSPRRPAC